jgi:hypothetical protein
MWEVNDKFIFNLDKGVCIKFDRFSCAQYSSSGFCVVSIDTLRDESHRCDFLIENVSKDEFNDFIYALEKYYGSDKEVIDDGMWHNIKNIFYIVEYDKSKIINLNSIVSLSFVEDNFFEVGIESFLKSLYNYASSIGKLSSVTNDFYIYDNFVFGHTMLLNIDKIVSFRKTGTCGISLDNYGKIATMKLIRGGEHNDDNSSIQVLKNLLKEIVYYKMVNMNLYEVQ